MRTLTEKEAEHFLEKKGFEIANKGIIKNKEDLSSIVKKIKFPWAMKVSSKSIIHKLKEGGVILNVDSLEKARKEFDKLSCIEGFEEIIVQPMLLGNEIIIGIKKTPEFSHVLMFGRGGPLAEREKDVSFRVLPISDKDLNEMIAETKIFSVLKRDNANFNKIKKVIKKTANLALKNKNILELDINPLIVNSKDSFVVDARVMFED